MLTVPIVTQTPDEIIAAANLSANVTPVGERHGLDSGKRFDRDTTIKAATVRVLIALCRPGVVLDVMSSWADLLAAKEINPSPLAIGIAWWDAMAEAVHAAIDAPDDIALWMAADEQVRGYARHSALLCAQEAKKLQGTDHWDDVEEERREEINLYHSQAARLTAFAAGRA